ncbi:MAG: glycosyl hydrolase [Myxococcota bacterium]
MLRWLWSFALVVGLLSCGGGAVEVDGETEFSEAVFGDPPREFGPQGRWWWPGASVERETLVGELSQFASLGHSAVEIQPFLSAMTRAALERDDRIRGVGSPAFLEGLSIAACAAADAGLAWDLTFGSGWSTGSPDVGDDGSRQLVMGELTLDGPSSFDGALPVPGQPDWVEDTNSILPAVDGFDAELSRVAVVGAEVIEQRADGVVVGEVIDLAPNVLDGVLTWEVPDGRYRVFAVYENRTLHYPVANAYPGSLEGSRIIDHLDRRGVQAFLEGEFEAWIDAVADCPPRAVFVDSFELVGELPWTTTFASKFESMKGYDITSYLPFLFLEGGESEYTRIFGRGLPRYQATDDRGVRAREDYESVRGSLFEEEMIEPLREWLGARGSELRLQAHGGYADILDAYGMADVPESEGLYAGGSYDFLRLAASSAETGGRRFASSETLVSVGAAELTEQEARIAIGRAFSAGINRLMFHGFAYPYVQPGGERWYPFRPVEDSAVTTGPLDLAFDLHPGAEIWDALPSLNQMVTRLGYAMSRGSAVSQVAWLYSEQEVENFPNSGVEPGAFESETSRVLRRAGFQYARVSRKALASSTSDEARLSVGAASFEVLLVEGVDALDPEVLRGVERAAVAGVPVLWLGAFPSRAEGLVDAEARDAEVEQLVDELRGEVSIVTGIESLPGSLESVGVEPALGPAAGASLLFSVARRSVEGASLYFVFNESFEERTQELRIGGLHGAVRVLDPDSGSVASARVVDGVVALTLSGARGAILWVASP